MEVLIVLAIVLLVFGGPKVAKLARSKVRFFGASGKTCHDETRDHNEPE